MPLLNIGISGNASGRNLYAFMRTQRGRVRLGAGALDQSWAGGAGYIQTATNQYAGKLSLGAQNMMALGEFAIGVLRGRVWKGMGSDDQPMKPLAKGYAIAKTRKGLGNRRNLIGTGEDGGHMLDAIRVTQVSAASVKIDISTSAGRKKAAANERRSPWWGFSRSDARMIAEEARRIFQATVTDITPILTGIGLAAKPRWMNPNNKSSVWRNAA